MNVTITPGKLSGGVCAIPSKSHAHRALICAAFADGPTTLLCRETNRDIEATAAGLIKLGAKIVRTEQGYNITPVVSLPQTAEINCHDSGSTLRFLLPLVGALGVDTLFHMEGRLPQRPLSPLWEEMERMGCMLSRPTPDTIRCQGRLMAGIYEIPGNISSQYITGLLLSLIHLKGNSSIRIIGTLESAPYIDLTLETLRQFQVLLSPEAIPGGQALRSPGTLRIEGDWSNSAFFLAATALGNNVTVTGLSRASTQGDRAVAPLLSSLEKYSSISAEDIPDLVPILSVVAAAKSGAEFTNIQRLRLKESDRVDTVIHMLHALGGKAHATADTLTVLGTGLHGGTVDATNDHRIAMSAAIAATVCTVPVTIIGADCVQKSYPLFWEEFIRLGGNYEQHIR